MSAASPEIRHRLYKRLTRHNRVISVLRFAIPALAIGLLVLPATQIIVSMVSEVIPIAGIRLDNDTLVIDTPRFDGRTATGTVYRMTAARAESRIGDLDIADLYDMRVDLRDDGDYRALALFSAAQWTMSQERLISNEDVTITDSTGMQAVLGGVDIDWPGQIVTSQGPVAITFGDGNQLDAATMVHDMDAAIWQFGSVHVEMRPTADTDTARDPFAEEFTGQ